MAEPSSPSLAGRRSHPVGNIKEVREFYHQKLLSNSYRVLHSSACQKIKIVGIILFSKEKS